MNTIAIESVYSYLFENKCFTQNKWKIHHNENNPIILDGEKVPIDLHAYYVKRDIKFSYDEIKMSKVDKKNLLINLIDLFIRENFSSFKEYNEWQKENSDFRFPFDSDDFVKILEEQHQFYEFLGKIPVFNKVLNEIQNLDKNKKYFLIKKEIFNFTCTDCGYEWTTNLQQIFYRGSGCKNCGIINCINNARKSRSRRKSIFDVMPDLFNYVNWDHPNTKELQSKFDSKLQGLNSGSDEYLNCFCKECGISYQRQVKSFKKSEYPLLCKECTRPLGGKTLVEKKIKEYGSFAKTHPEQAKYWDYEKNVDKPCDVYANSPKKRHFYCEKCLYKWEAQINTVAHLQSRCHCFNNFPKAELFIYLSLKNLGFQVNHQFKFSRQHFDCYIDDKLGKFAFEIDGYFHNDSKQIARDISKEKFCHDNNIKLFRLRDESLENDKITCHYITYSDRKYFQNKIDKIKLYEFLIDLFSNIFKVYPDDRLNTFDNIIFDKIMQDYYEFLNKRYVPNSLFEKKPDLAHELLDRDPKSISCKSHEILNFKCTKCDYQYLRSASNITRDTDKGCPYCSNAKNYVTNKNNLLVLFPKVVDAFWDYDKNEIDPSNVRPHSKILIWIKCQHGCSVQIPVNALTRKKCKNFKCPCGPNKKNIKPEDD